MAPIRVETGRYGANRIPVHQRLCPFCDASVEDEYHFIFECDMYNDERKSLMDYLRTVEPNFTRLNRNEQLKLVFGNQHNEGIRTLTKTLSICFDKRPTFL